MNGLIASMQAHSMKPTMKAVAKTGGMSRKPVKCSETAGTTSVSSTMSVCMCVVPGMLGASICFFFPVSVTGFGHVDGTRGLRRQPDDEGGDDEAQRHDRHHLVGRNRHRLT